MVKRIAAAIVLVILAVTLIVPALADEIMYCTENKVKVYATRSKDSEVIRRLSKGESVILEVAMKEIKDWYGILCTDSDGGHMIGWVEQKYLVSCLHEWGKWTVTRQPTCTQTGKRERKCVKCGATQTGDVGKLDHEWGKAKVTREATCTREGEQVRTCKNCGTEQTQKIKKTPHDFGSWIVLKAATCTEKGERKHVCRDCGFEEKKATDKLPHSFGEWNIVLEATDHSSGIREHVCQSCGYGERKDYDPEGTLRRKDKGDAVSKLQQLLVDQGYLKPKGADGVFGGGTEKAVMQFQKDQGLTPDGVAWPQTQQRLRHDYGDWETVTALTRASDGERVRVCKDCGHEERQTVKAEPSIARRQKGGAVKAVQGMLNDLGFNAGKADGSYGPKLDKAFEAFAGENGLEFNAGSLLPADIDALVNRWVEAQSQDAWMGAGDKDSPVNLILTLVPSPETEEEASSRMRTFDWEVTNLGSRKCTFSMLLMAGGEDHDFMRDDMAAALDSAELKPDGANRVGGSVTLSEDWFGDEGVMSFCAVARADKTGEKWTSNVAVLSIN